MKVTVTQEHIDRARKNREKDGYHAPSSCPIALALRDKLWFPKYIGVSCGTVRCESLGGLWDQRMYYLSEDAQNFVMTFDMETKAEARVQPCKLKLRREYMY